MKNQTNLIKRIRNIIVGNTLPANEDLWLDTSDGEKKSVLKYKGNPIVGGGGGGSTNPDYNVTKQTVTLFNDTVETQELGGIYQAVVENIDFDLIAGENYTVVFDGTSYDVKAIVSPYDEDNVLLGEINGGGPSFETYPFVIMYADEEGAKSMMFVTTIEGSHTVVIKQEEETVTATPEFKSAVDSVTGYSIDKGNETLYDGTVETVVDEEYNIGIITPTITFVEGDTYKVTLNGTEYTCKCLSSLGVLYVGALYGDEGFDWSTYPFSIDTQSTNHQGTQLETELCTNQEGSYTLKIEHLTFPTKTTPAFVSMIQGIAGSGSTSGCQIIYPDDIVWSSSLCSIYNNPPEEGKIYFIPFMDNGSTGGEYLYPVYISELTNDNNQISGSATIIGTPIVTDNGTLTVQPFNRTINPSRGNTKGLLIDYYSNNNEYRLSYGTVFVPAS